MALEFPENTSLASHYVKKALPMMIKNDIAPNPCNFALWYAYVANRDRTLNSELDQTIAAEGTCPDPVSRKLFKEHVIKEEIELQKNLQDSLTNVLKELSGSVSETRSGADDFCHSLEASLDQMLENPDPEAFQATVRDLIDTTRAASEMASGFQGQLAAAEDEIANLKQQLELKEQETYIDALTQVANRRAFDRRLIELCQDDARDVTLILVDLDHFKSLNDNYGHLMGDKVLQGVGQVMQQLCPENALAARYGGEEFAYLVEGDIEAAAGLAEATRQMLGKLILRKKNSDEVIDNITASFGVAQRSEQEFPEQIIERADGALYHAKESGRDRVERAA